MAERAGVNSALVHVHFGSDEALRRAAVEHALDGQVAWPVAAAAEAHGTLDGIVAAVAGLATDGAQPSGRRLVAEALVQCLRDDRLRTGMTQRLGMARYVLAARLAAIQEGGGLRTDADPGALAVILTARADGLRLHLMADPGFDIRSPAASLVALLRPGGTTGTRTP